MSEITGFTALLVNTDQSKLYDQLVNHGWANLSDGSVESPTGAFAVVWIEEAELAEVRGAFSKESAIFDGGEDLIKVGSFLTHCDGDGNKTLYQFNTLDDCMEQYNALQAEYERWWKGSAIAADITALGRTFGAPDCEEDGCEGVLSESGKCTICGKVGIRP
jgi:hypothetical protein